MTHFYFDIRLKLIFNYFITQNNIKMQGQLTEERILYRCRKTVLEMLRDRGYEIGDAEIEETFEEFESRKLNLDKDLNMIVKRPIPGRTSVEIMDEHDNPGQMKEPIFVAFSSEQKLGQEAFRNVILYMHNWSCNTNKDRLCNDLSNAIIVVKGATS